MPFANLALELKQQIFREYVQITDITEVIRAREVCRAFNTLIDDELTSNFRIDYLGVLGLLNYTDRRLMTILHKRVVVRPPSTRLPDESEDFSSYVQNIADALVSYHPQDAALEQVRAQYTNDIISMLASPRGFPKCQTILSHNRKWYLISQDDEKFRSNFKKYVGSKDLKVKDLATAAAATENLYALNKYKQNLFYAMGDLRHDDKMDTFINCWYAAAWNGKIESVQFLLRQLNMVLPEELPSADEIFLRKTAAWSGSGQQSSTDEIDLQVTFYYIHGATTAAIVRGHNEIAKILIECLIRLKNTVTDSDWGSFLNDLTQFSIVFSNIEIFDFVYASGLQVKNYKYYNETFVDGVVSACRDGQAGMIEHLFRSGHKLTIPVGHHSYWNVYWKGNHWGSIEASDLLFLATAYSRVKVMEVLLKYKVDVKNSNTLLRAAVLGFWVDRRTETWRRLPRVEFFKSGSRYEALQFLLDRKIRIDRSAVYLVNQCAKLIHTELQGYLSPDVCMAMILLLDVLKTRFGKGDSLRKEVHRGVTRVLRRVVDGNLDLPSPRDDFVCVALDLLEWLPRLRSLVAKKPKPVKW